MEITGSFESVIPICVLEGPYFTAPFFVKSERLLSLGSHFSLYPFLVALRLDQFRLHTLDELLADTDFPALQRFASGKQYFCISYTVWLECWILYLIIKSIGNPKAF